MTILKFDESDHRDIVADGLEVHVQWIGDTMSTKNIYSCFLCNWYCRKSWQHKTNCDPFVLVLEVGGIT